MKIVYASRTGNVENLVAQLGVDNINVADANGIKEDYILITYTDGAGDIPFEVESFLSDNAALMKGVIASGDHSYGEENYCAAGDKIAAMYGVPCLYKVENSGTADDVKAIMAIVV